MSRTSIYFFQANVATRHDILVNLFGANKCREECRDIYTHRASAVDKRLHLVHAAIHDVLEIKRIVRSQLGSDETAEPGRGGRYKHTFCLFTGVTRRRSIVKRKYMSLSYAPARGCDAVLNAWCDQHCPHRARHGPLLARLDGADGHPGAAWRCYARSTLTADGNQWSSGKEYCTRHKQRDRVSRMVILL